MRILRISQKMTFSRPWFTHYGRKAAAGYTLVELLVTMTVLGVLAAVTLNAKPWYENSLGNGRDQMVGILKLVRLRAMSTTSTYRILPDSANPTRQLKVELTKNGSCQASTNLSAAALTTATSLTVVDNTGFSVGDSIQVGTDAQNNDIISLPDNSTITLGQALGTDQAANATVTMLKTWVNDSNFMASDLLLPQNITMSGKRTDTNAAINWTVCVNSQGFITLYQNTTPINTNLAIALTNSRTSEVKTVTLYQGGAVDAP
jgi:prepilin-type N-terminal cleavage/methylation domain-containing protein